MNISIFGLGYVGAVTAGCLAKQGHGIVGVDVHPQKVADFNRGVPPIVEPGLDELLKDAKAQNRLRATQDVQDAIGATDLSIICVGTPSTAAGALDLGYVRTGVQQIGDAIRKLGKKHYLVFRSTMLPGSTAKIVEEFLGDLLASGAIQIFYYPEFLRESTAVADFENPSLVVVGSRDGSRPAEELMKGLFGEKASVVNWQTAEMIKYACNAFHATKIAFANEIGRIGKQMGIDAGKVMSLICLDTKLNLSPYYMKPGNPFGGSCLPKDVRALTNCARQRGVNLPMMESLLPSNERHMQSLLQLISDAGQKEIIILGLSFKANTDDLRESAMVELAQIFLGRGYTLRIYDPALNLAAMVGANKRVVDLQLPHLASELQTELKDALGQKGVVIAAQKCAPIAELKKFITPQHHVIDVNGWAELRELPSKYEGFCW